MQLNAKLMKEMKKVLGEDENSSYLKEDYLSKNNTNCLKGIFAICVLMCHLRSRVEFLNDTLVGSLLTVLGYLSVSVFFFLSGYGLTVSYKRKGEEYIKSFPKKRLLSFYVTYLIALFIYVVYKLIINGLSFYKWTTIIKSLTFGGTYVNNGWYLQAILVFYILFYFVFRFVKSDKTKILLVTIFLSLYCIFCLTVKNIGGLWCECSFSFLLGICWAFYKNKIDEFLSKKTAFWLSTIVIFCIACLTILLGAYQGLSDYVRISIKMISSVSFAAFVMLAIRLIPVNFMVTRFLGRISMEIYIIHGLFMSLFCNVLAITSAWVFVPLITICTIISAIILKPLFDWSSRLVKGETYGKTN